MDDMVSSRVELLQNIDAGWNRFYGYLKTLSDEQLSTPTDASGWTVKDHLTHLAIWEDGIYGLLMGHSRREQMGIDEATWQDAGRRTTLTA